MITSSIGLGPESEPTLAGLTITGLTASRLIATDADKALESTDLASWVAGTTNRITVTDDSDGTITLSTPQDIHTGASPTFAGITLSGITSGVLWSNSGVITGDAPLNLLANPNANKTFNMTTRQLGFLWTNPSGNPLEFEASGAYTGSLLHIHQHTGNPGNCYLLTLESSDEDVEHIGSTGPATTTDAFCTYVTGDTEERFVIHSDGSLAWGAGGAAATDTTLYRSAAGVLKTNGSLIIADAGNIGSASDTDAMAISAGGEVSFTVFPVTPNAAPDADLEVANKKYVDDNISSCVAGRRVSVYLSSAQAVASTTYTKIQFAAENYDKLGEWDAGNYNFTPSAAGYYHVCSFVNISLTDGSDKSAILALYLNGATILAQNLSDRGSDATVANVFLAKTVSLLTTDTIDLRIYHYDGGNRNVTAGQGYSYVTIDRVND